MRKIGVALFLVVAVLVFAQERPFSAVTNVTAIDVTVEVVDDDGRTPADLKPSDFAIFEDGVERPVVAVEYLSGGGQATLPVPSQPVAIEGQAGSPVLQKPVERPGPWDILIYIDY